MAPPIDTRLGPGTLTIGGTERGAQISNVTLEPAHNSSDGTPTLGDPDPLPEITESWVLKGEAVQDLEAATGFVNYCFNNALTVVAFVFTPNTIADAVYSGDVLITSVPIGGDVSKQNVSAFEFAVQGTPTFNPPGAAPAGGVSSREAAAARAARRSSVAPRAASKGKKAAASSSSSS